jgi:hypothetical protein
LASAVVAVNVTRGLIVCLGSVYDRLVISNPENKLPPVNELSSNAVIRPLDSAVIDAVNHGG